MKILMVHNYYGSGVPSGENIVFERERKMLIEHGHEVESFCRTSDEIRTQGLWGLINGGLSTPWNPWMARAIRIKVEAFRPDIVHVHNTFPLISPAIFWAIGKRAKKVMTLHNYQTFCAAAIPMYEERICLRCMDGHNVWSALIRRCYRKSFFATLPQTLRLQLHRKLETWVSQVDTLIMLSEYQRRIMQACGFSRVRCVVKPNYYDGNPDVTDWNARSNAIVFVGRLSVEKGVRFLIDAWARWGAQAPELRIIGDGPLRPELELAAQGLPVHFLGRLKAPDVQREIGNAKLLVFPSIWIETFGLVILEAFAHGTPVAVSNLGPLPSIVADQLTGLIFSPASANDLLRVVRNAWGAQEHLAQMGAAARKEFELKYTETANYNALMEIYRTLLETKA